MITKRTSRKMMKFNKRFNLDMYLDIRRKKGSDFVTVVLTNNGKKVSHLVVADTSIDFRMDDAAQDLITGFLVDNNHWDF